jgi:hypothetical protein
MLHPKSNMKPHSFSCPHQPAKILNQSPKKNKNKTKKKHHANPEIKKHQQT